MLDKAKTVWYNNQAVWQGNAGADESGEKLRKKLKKVLDKPERIC